MSEDALGWASLFAIALALIGIFMMFVTKCYVNRSKRRRRLIELIFGVSNGWYQGESFDLVMANLFVSGATFTAWRMKLGFVTKKQKEMGAYAYPALHKDFNYIKLLDEFKFFVGWEAVKAALIVISLLIGTIVYGFSEGWW